jgi:hypothetical protein
MLSDMDGDVFGRVTKLGRAAALLAPLWTKDALQRIREASLGRGVNAFENHASSLRACRTFDDLVDLDPDVRFATALPLPDSLAENAPGAAVFAMYQRYAVEIQAYFAAARPDVIKRPPQPRKDRERDLFSAAG